MSYEAYLKLMPALLRQQLETSVWYADLVKQGVPLEEQLSSAERTRAIYAQMTPIEKTVLHVTVNKIGCALFDLLRLERECEGLLSGAEVKAGLNRILHKGILIAFRKSWGEQGYMLPAEGFRVWRQHVAAEEQPLLSRELVGGGSLNSEDTASPPAAHDLRRKLFFLLQECTRHSLKLTKTGALHKKTIIKLEEAAGLQDACFSRLGLKYAHSNCITASLAVCFDFLLKLGLIEVSAEEWCLNTKRLALWLQLHPAAQQHYLYVHWLFTAMPDNLVLQHAVMELELVPEGERLGEEELLSRLLAKGMITPAAASAEELLDSFHDQWVKPLAAYGWLEAGELRPGRRYYCWINKPEVMTLRQKLSSSWHEEGGSKAKYLVVQPDFEVLAMPDAPLSLCWELERFAERRGSEMVMTYRMNKASVQRALEQGLSAEEMLQTLECATMYGVPEHISAKLKDWAGSYGKAVFDRVLLLRCADASIAEQVERLEGVYEYAAEKLGDRVFAVRSGQADALRSRLESMGIYTQIPPGLSDFGELEPEKTSDRMDWEEAGHMAPAEFLPMLPQTGGLIYPRLILPPIENKLPEMEELYPELHRIPQGWLKEYRTYHDSTRKEIAQTAVEWKAVLQVRRNGADCLITPKKLVETRGTWCLNGWEKGGQAWQAAPVQLLAEDWQEMKLILPGINEK